MIQVHLRQVSRNGAYHYCVAGRSVICDFPLPLLLPFRASDPPQISFIDSKLPFSFQDHFVSRGTHWVGGCDRQVEIRAGDNHFRIEMEEIATFLIHANGSRIDIAPSVDADDLIAEALLGPPLILCLALHGIFCLHASAVRFNDRVIAFLGQSGAGKSTLGRHWASENITGRYRICDDVLPVEMSDGTVNVLPHFPQLKYGIEHQYRLSEPNKLPLSAAYVLSADETEQQTEIIALTCREAALALLSHTVGSRLLDNSLLKDHWNFCTRAAGVLKIARLRYPRKMEALPEIENFLLRQTAV